MTEPEITTTDSAIPSTAMTTTDPNLAGDNVMTVEADETTTTAAEHGKLHVVTPEPKESFMTLEHKDAPKPNTEQKVEELHGAPADHLVEDTTTWGAGAQDPSGGKEGDVKRESSPSLILPVGADADGAETKGDEAKADVEDSLNPLNENERGRKRGRSRSSSRSSAGSSRSSRSSRSSARSRSRSPRRRRHHSRKRQRSASRSRSESRRRSVEASAPPRLGRKVFVGNLGYSVTDAELKQAFVEGVGEGTVSEAVVLQNHDGRSKGCGIVTFETDEAAQQAVDSMQERDIKGRPIFLREDREETTGTARRTNASGSSSRGGGGGGRAVPPNTHPDCFLFVGNLPFDVRWQELKDHFRRAGPVIKADVLIFPDTHRSKGVGTVVFEHPEDARNAIRMFNGTNMKGRELFVREDRAAGGGHGGNGGYAPHRSVDRYQPDRYRDRNDSYRPRGSDRGGSYGYPDRQAPRYGSGYEPRQDYYPPRGGPDYGGNGYYNNDNNANYGGGAPYDAAPGMDYSGGGQYDYNYNAPHGMGGYGGGGYGGHDDGGYGRGYGSGGYDPAAPAYQSSY